MTITTTAPPEMKQARINISHFFAECENLTNQEIADATGIHANTVSAYRGGGISRPDALTLMRLKNFFEQRTGRTVHIEEFIEVRDG